MGSEFADRNPRAATDPLRCDIESRARIRLIDAEAIVLKSEPVGLDREMRVMQSFPHHGA
ncbi:hypothetical protein IB279_17650 [Ensifer sp. ENS06]|uniref:hypothetical protein n=1 Tax=Ensifer sp. ENS06 TaxID=2769276 RepID=UPI00177B50C1|nr:hypothetical protein [Ensifer sp. ENS06]MBD9624768.1 hypothetical protein [Ensifer sp. ENS06]